jgi:hypothetical protein
MKCGRCEKEYINNEFDTVVTTTYGYYNDIVDGRRKWSDCGVVLVPIERCANGKVKL